MFRFFRHIRQNLLQQSKVSRYLGYAVGEIVLIMIGIFLALQLNNWNEERKDRIEEREILTRLSSEVTGNAHRLSDILEKSIPETQTALERVVVAFAGEPISDNAAFLFDVIRSGSFGYFTPTFRVDTYNELVSTGKLQLIQTVDLRDLVSGYYSNTINNHERAEALKGSYGLLTYELIPRKVGNINTDVDTLSDEAAVKVVAAVLDSELHRHITPQRNRLNYLKYSWTLQLELANKLLAEIQAELSN